VLLKESAAWRKKVAAASRLSGVDVEKALDGIGYNPRHSTPANAVDELTQGLERRMG